LEKKQRLFMVINQILKQLTPQRIKQEVKAVQKTKYSSELKKWITRFNQVGERPDFIWRWLYMINKDWFYSPIQKKYAESLAKTNTLYDMFVVLLDDAAEIQGKERLLSQLMLVAHSPERINQSSLSQKDKKYLNFTIAVWKEIMKEARSYPNYEIIKDFFEYDTAQFLNAVRFANIVFKHPYSVNSKECWLYLPHSMQVLLNYDIDLMANKTINKNDLGRARRAVLCLQEMGRIGNWLTTWERELRADDYTSVVIPYSLENNFVTMRELQAQDKDKVIKKINRSGVDRYFLKKEWENRYKQLENLSRNNTLINRSRILKKAKYLITLHLISRGLK
jgi:hypothetical protein